jgi:hypothetical protein
MSGHSHFLAKMLTLAKRIAVACTVRQRLQRLGREFTHCTNPTARACNDGGFADKTMGAEHRHCVESLLSV